MASLTHALLAEDESVLLDGLNPGPQDFILTLFARGNGDAALSLLQSGASVRLYDLFDQKSLVAQFEFKKWLFSNLDNTSLRKFIGVMNGFDPADRDPIINAALSQIPPQCRAFWAVRSACLRGGMVQTDSMSRWGRKLDWFMKRYRDLSNPIKGSVLLFGRLLAPFFFPREERKHSLGYRQLLQNPETVLQRFIGKQERRSATEYIPLQDFKYLQPEGHDAVRRNLHRAVVIDQLPPMETCSKVYFSNALDYLSGEGFETLLRRILPRLREGWRALLNSTYSSEKAHPHLEAGIRDGLYRINWEGTAKLRLKDRVGAYAGLTLISGI